MFTMNNCEYPSCRKAALTYFDGDKQIQPGNGYCLEHCQNLQEAQEEICKYVDSHEKIVGLCATEIHFENMDLTNKKFYGCNFQHCTFSNIHSEGLRIRMSFFDFAIFSDCNLIASNIMFTSMGGCIFSHALITNSDLIQNNFCGISAYQSSFDDSDLYNSRFMVTKLINTSFRNCNLKGVNFTKMEQENVSFKMSNTREAIFSKDAELNE
jgi:uncharacterized protein YjbI with pentapeptide repeats